MRDLYRDKTSCDDDDDDHDDDDDDDDDDGLKCINIYLEHALIPR